MVYLEYIEATQFHWSMCVCTRHEKWPVPTIFQCLISQGIDEEPEAETDKWVGERAIDEVCSGLDMFNTPITITLMMRGVSDVGGDLEKNEVPKLEIQCDVVNGVAGEFHNHNGDVVEPSALPKEVLEDFILKQFLIKMLYDRTSNTQVNNIIEAMLKTHADHSFEAIELIIRYQLNKQIRDK